MQAGLMARTHKPPTLVHDEYDKDENDERRRSAREKRTEHGGKRRKRKKTIQRQRRNVRTREVTRRGEGRRRKRAIGVFTVFPRRHTGTGVYARHPQKRTL